ncbi:MAG: hypothetical protein AAGC97_03525 [Planctomycetota bacterium]
MPNPRWNAVAQTTCTTADQPIDLDTFTTWQHPQAHRIQLITFHYNPCRFRRLRDTYFEWLPTLGPMADRLKCYELVFDDDEPEIPGSVVIRGSREKHWLWQKEAIVNRAHSECDRNIDYFAWLDHDMVPTSPDWLNQAITQIDQGASAVQLGSAITYLDRSRCPIETMATGAANWLNHQRKRGCPGAAWIADRHFLDDIGGFNTHHIVGGGDQSFFDIVTGSPGQHLDQYPDALAHRIRAHTQRAIAHRTNRQLAYIDQALLHLWHGDRSKRQYQSRNTILRDHNFDPTTDVRINHDGILEWSSNKPTLHAAIRRYFQRRAEDG